MQIIQWFLCHLPANLRSVPRHTIKKKLQQLWM